MERGHAQVLHSVAVRDDTLFGVPFIRPPTCDACRVAIPLAQIDSLQLGDLERTGLVAVFVPIGALFLVFALLYTPRGAT